MTRLHGDILSAALPDLKWDSGSAVALMAQSGNRRSPAA
jgi:hypothetical protein